MARVNVRVAIAVGALGAAAPAGAQSSAPASKPAAAVAADEELLRTVEEIRGLKRLREIERVVLEPKEFLEEVRRVLRTTLDVGETVGSLRSLEFVGLVPHAKFDVRAHADHGAEAYAGVYDPTTKRVIALRADNGELDRWVLAHELCHAIDDQYFDFDRVLRSRSFDERFAASCVIEGNAMLVASALPSVPKREGQPATTGGPTTPSGPPPDVARSPYASFLKLQDFVLEPYFGGPAFLSFHPADASPAALERYPRDAVGKAFSAWPRSSEHILHPEKYWVAELRDDPVPVRLPDLTSVLGAGWSSSYENVFGEMTVAIMTAGELSTSSSRASRLMDQVAAPTPAQVAQALRTPNTPASEGCGGDRFALWEHAGSGASLLVWGSVWDTEKDAEEMERALPKVEGVDVLASRKGERLAVTFARGAVDRARVDAARTAVLESVPPRGRRRP